MAAIEEGKKAPEFTLLCDSEKNVLRQYGAFGKKMMYGKEAQGVNRSTAWVGPDGSIKKHWAKVKGRRGSSGGRPGGDSRQTLTATSPSPSDPSVFWRG